MTENKKYAIFIDGDNISPRYLEPILSEVAKDGDILIRRIYGDWTTNNMNGWKNLLLDFPVRPVQQFRNGSQATDYAIIMDAIELANINKEINAICIVSSDADYFSLALKLREYGLFVLGMGERKSNPLLIKSCNQFKYLDNIAAFGSRKQIISSDQQTHESIVSLDNLLDNAYINSRSDETGWVSLSDLGKSIRNIMPDFDPRAFNHETLRAMLEAMPELYELNKDNLVPPNYWIRKIFNNTSQPVKLTGKIKRWLGHYGFIQTTEGDFYFLLSNIVNENRGHFVKVDDDVEFEIFKYPNPDGEGADKNGRASNVRFLNN